MRLKTQTISLGGHEWPVRPLTLRQVQAIEPILMDRNSESGGHIGGAIAIVGIALERDHPDVAAKLGDIEATAGEIGAALETVLRLGGFIDTRGKEGDERLGESGAGAIG
jgi:hypothetical protein